MKQPGNKSVAAKETHISEKSPAKAQPELDVEPSKIKTVLFLEPEKANGHHDWLQGDTSRISTVWPQGPETAVSEPAGTEQQEKSETDVTFRKIISE